MATPNPSTITFDLSGIGAQLSTAINDAANNIKTTLVDAVKQAATIVSEQASAGLNEGEEEVVDISGMRQQILANVEVLYPILAQSRDHSHGSGSIQEPRFHLVTGGRCPKIFGCVLYSFAGPGVTCQLKEALIDGPDAPTTFPALERLLDLTRQMLAENRVKYAKEPDGMWWSHEGEGASKYYYKP